MRRLVGAVLFAECPGTAAGHPVPTSLLFLRRWSGCCRGGHRGKEDSGKEAEVKQQIYSLEQDSISQEQA